MNRMAIALVLASVLGLTACNRASDRSLAGPSGGDLVPIQNGAAYAELLANADTGELMVHTWDKDRKTIRPIASAPLVVGSGEQTVELMPHPVDSDPQGSCSRFYGQAEWVRGGGVRQGWMHGEGIGGHQEFAWQRCFQGGKTHGQMWSQMGEHRHMGPGHGPGHGGAHPEE